MSLETSPMSSPLSSIPSTLSHDDLIRTTDALLQTYHADSPDDKTICILSTFVRYLPGDGARNIVEDILECNSDETLRQLASHLHTGVLVPSK